MWWLIPIALCVGVLAWGIWRVERAEQASEQKIRDILNS